MTFSLPVFKGSALWQQAMTHKSFANEQPVTVDDNERLEFLGDAILTFISAEYLYARFPNRPEGELTPMRAALVDRPQLYRFAQQLGLGRHLQLGKGAQKEGAQRNSRLLCSAFEALIGAYFLDVGREMKPVKDYVIPMFDSAITRAIEASAKDVKTRLQERTHIETGEQIEYIDISSSGPDHAKTFVVEVRIGKKAYARAQGPSKKEAQKIAARLTLEQLEMDENQ
ncbi:MAG: ribonuclease III [Cyanobacteria bacterium P01_D01_bin.1]